MPRRDLAHFYAGLFAGFLELYFPEYRVSLTLRSFIPGVGLLEHPVVEPHHEEEQQSDQYGKYDAHRPMKQVFQKILPLSRCLRSTMPSIRLPIRENLRS